MKENMPLKKISKKAPEKPKKTPGRKQGYAVITGASAGIGRAFAYALAKRGYDLFLMARREQKLQEITNDIEVQYGVQVGWKVVNLLEKRERAEVCELLIAEYEIEILINNAGFGLQGRFMDLERTRQIDMIETNVCAVVDLSHRLLPALMKNEEQYSRAYLINIASVGSFQPGAYYAIYYATKSFVLSMSEAIAEEMRRDKKNIIVSAICPGPTQSEFFDIANMKLSPNAPTAEELSEYALKRICNKRRSKASRTVLIHGIGFKIVIFFERFMSRAFVRRITGVALARRLKGTD